MKYSMEVLDFWEKVKKKTDITGDFADSWGYGDNLNSSLIYGLLSLIQALTLWYPL